MASAPDIHDPDGELAAFADELRTALARPLPPHVEERHLTAIVGEAKRAAAARRTATAPAATAAPPRRRWGRRRFAFRIAPAALGALLAASAALAAVGVRPLDSAYERVGIDLDADPPPAENAAPDAGPGAGASDAKGSGAGSGQGRPELPGARRSETGERNSAPGRATADEVREQGGPPTSPGRSGDHAPPGTGPPADPPAKGGSAPTSPPGEARAAPPQGAQGFDRAGASSGRGDASLRRRAIEGGSTTP